MKRKVWKAKYICLAHGQDTCRQKTAKQDDGMQQKLERLPLPQHTIQALKREGIYSIQDVLSRKNGEWEGIRNFTQGDFNKLVNVLKNRGIAYDVKFDPQTYNHIREQWEQRDSSVHADKLVYKWENSHVFVKQTGLPASIVNRLKQILTGDFYFIQEIQDIFMDEFPHEHVWKLDFGAIAQLGFFTEDNYAVAKRFRNAAAYFSSLLEQDTADLRDRPYLHKISLFNQVMNNKKRALDIVEVKPMVFWNIQHLKEMGITKPEMRVFRNRVDECTKEKEYFTIFSLRKSGFSLPWTELHLDDWFYSSVLIEGRPRFRYIQFGDNRLIRNSIQFFKVEDFLHSILCNLGKPIEFQELMHYIKETYGCCRPDKKLKQIISKDPNLFQRVELY